MKPESPSAVCQGWDGISLTDRGNVNPTIDLQATEKHGLQCAIGREGQE